MTKIYEKDNGDWKLILYGCQYCFKAFKKESSCINHELKCKNINTIKEEYANASTKDNKNGKN
jgi:hypothetical protein